MSDASPPSVAGRRCRLRAPVGLGRVVDAVVAGEAGPRAWSAETLPGRAFTIRRTEGSGSIRTRPATASPASRRPPTVARQPSQRAGPVRHRRGRARRVDRAAAARRRGRQRAAVQEVAYRPARRHQPQRRVRRYRTDRLQPRQRLADDAAGGGRGAVGPARPDRHLRQAQAAPVHEAVPAAVRDQQVAARRPPSACRGRLAAPAPGCPAPPPAAPRPTPPPAGGDRPGARRHGTEPRKQHGRRRGRRASRGRPRRPPGRTRPRRGGPPRRGPGRPAARATRDRRRRRQPAPPGRRSGRRPP